MSRDLTSGAQAAIGAEHVPALLLVELDFSGGAVRVTNAGQNFDWNGNAFYGVGHLGGIEPVQEGAELQMYGVAMSLSGIPTEMIAVALGEHYQGRAASVWFAPLDTAYRIVADPVLVFRGRIDTMDIDMGTTATIQLTAESRLTDWDKPRVRRYTDEDQQAAYPGDLGLQFVVQMAEKEIVWGRA